MPNFINRRPRVVAENQAFVVEARVRELAKDIMRANFDSDSHKVRELLVEAADTIRELRNGQ